MPASARALLIAVIQGVAVLYTPACPSDVQPNLVAKKEAKGKARKICKACVKVERERQRILGCCQLSLNSICCKVACECAAACMQHKISGRHAGKFTICAYGRNDH